MKALVIGGAGFIGSHTVDALIEKGYEVKILDNLQKPVHKNGVPKYLNPKAELIIGDICDFNNLELAMEDVSIVYNFAAYQDYLQYLMVSHGDTRWIYEFDHKGNGLQVDYHYGTSRFIRWGPRLYLTDEGPPSDDDKSDEEQADDPHMQDGR